MSYKIAMYTRLSKEDFEKSKIESESIVNQKSIIENFIKNNLELKGSEVVSYSDDGYVGSNFERPAIKQLIEDIKKNKINCVIVKDLSRFGRNYIEVNNYLDKIFPFFNIRFIAINDNYDSKDNKNCTTDLDIAFKNILYSYYSKDLSIKVKTGLRARAKQGYYIPAFAPFGYKKNKETKKLEIDEETAPIVKMIFELALQKNSLINICKILNNKKIPTSNNLKVKNGIRKDYNNKLDNKIWKYEDIRIILNNEVYTGCTITSKTKRAKCGSSKIMKSDDTLKIENTHQPIISKEIFNKVKSKNIEQSKNRKPKSIFSYKLKCGKCGYSLKYNYSYKNKQVIDRKYFCSSSRETDNSSCKNVNILESELKKIVFESLKKQILLYLKEKDEITDKTNLKKDILILEKQQKELISSRRLIYEDYINQKITKEDYLKIKLEKENLINEIKEKIKKLELEISEYKEFDEENKIFEKYMNSNELNQEMVDIFLKNIYIYDKDTIKIEWKFKKD